MNMPIATLKIEHGGASLTGKRAQNQDAILVKVPGNNQELTHKA
ncbi:hypothetical protein JCM19232_3650 [Vibrio ishigakensis]|uniref:Uncharacterized protein n=1 Tax=Vibrio ishigakensis TaxID=1481914 RepID=A0A0B8PBW6_9VIBR|nr:hypothetical protein JCM19232_3650 [Vibrio ishigakensis]